MMNDDDMLLCAQILGLHLETWMRNDDLIPSCYETLLLLQLFLQVRW
jgi:hypothetical protein